MLMKLTRSVFEAIFFRNATPTTALDWLSGSQTMFYLEHWLIDDASAQNFSSESPSNPGLSTKHGS